MSSNSGRSSRSNMRAIDTWSVNSERISYCAEQLRLGRIGLVLGAGASIEFNLPSWGQLLINCYKKMELAELAATASDLQRAEHLKEHIASKGLNFPELIRDALYAGYDRSAANLIGNRLLLSIGAIAMASSRGSASRLITYNYDTILESFLRYFGHSVHSIAELPDWQANADIEVYHPHGLLPPDDVVPETTRIILTGEDYDAAVGDHTELWNAIQLDIMRRHTCLFVGLGVNDGHLSNLLSEVKKTHASIAERFPYWGITFYREDETRPDIPNFWRTRGVFPIKIADYQEIPTFIFAVCQRAAEQARSA